MNHEEVSFPPFFETAIDRAYGPSERARIEEGSRGHRTVSFRVNAVKAAPDSVLPELDGAGIATEPVPWYADAFTAPDARERAFWELSSYQKGELYLQSLSSMIPPLVLDARPGEDVLDMCAAPGGKTSQICALGGPRVHVTACEKSAVRAEKLTYNLEKLGCTNVTLLRQDARKLDEFFRFDRILLDAPCSGSGTLRIGNAKQSAHFTPKLVDSCVRTQAALLERALGLLKPGGVLVYSTCSILPRENEAQVRAALNRMRIRGSFAVKPVELDRSEELPRLESHLDGALLLRPTARYEGFFVAKIERTA